MRKLLPPLLLLLACQAWAQDPIFSQFYAAPLQINPGFAGSSGTLRVGALYRDQWPGFSNAYRTYSVFYEQNLERLNSGIGFQVEGDNAGDGIYKTTRFSAIYAYRLQVTDDLALQLGAEGGIHQTALAWDRLVFPDQVDGIGGIINNTGETRPDATTHTRFDASAGLLLMHRYWWFGTGLKHLNTPSESFLLINDNVSRGLPLRYAVHGGTELIVKPGNKHTPPSFVSPNFLFVSQGPYRQLNVGAYGAAGSIFAGAWFRHTFRNSDALILLAGLREGAFKLGVSYDITVSGLAGRSGGAFEFSASVLLDRRKPDINNCLKMFQ